MIGASLCAATSVLVLSRTFRMCEVDLAYLRAFFLAVSVLPLAAPVGLPALVRRGTLADRFDAVWRTWVSVCSAFVISLGASLLIWTWLLPAPEVGRTAVPLAHLAGA